MRQLGDASQVTTIAFLIFFFFFNSGASPSLVGHGFRPKSSEGRSRKKPSAAWLLMPP